MNTDPTLAGIDPNEQLTIALIDTSEARREQARDAADARLAAETSIGPIDQGNITSENKVVRGIQTAREAYRAGGGFRGLVRRVWKGNVANEYYRQKYARQEESRIDETGNLYAGEEGRNSREAMGATVDRFTSEFADMMVHSGEKRRELEQGRDDPMRTSVFNLIGAYARDELDDNNFEEEKNRVVRELSQGNPQEFGEGLMFADNLLEIAQNVKAKVRHGIGLDEILASAKIVVGEARMGVRSEAKFNRVDRIVERIQNNRVGSMINETTVSTAAAIVASVTKFGTRLGTGRTAALLTGGVAGVAGGAIAGVRESKKLKQERAQHMRERAQGKQFNANAQQRAKFEETRYETRGAADMAADLRSMFDESGSLESVRDADHYRGMLTRLAEVRARINMSDSQGIDLIHYSGIDKVDSERFSLDLARAQVEVALRGALAGREDELVPPGLRTGNAFEDMLRTHELTFISAQNESIQNRDRVFDKMRRREVAETMAKATVAGFVIGTAVQELTAAVTPGTAGMFEDVSSSEAGDKHSTVLRSLFRGEGVQDSITFNPEDMHQVGLSERLNLSLPENYTAGQDVNNPLHWEINGPNGHVADVMLNQDGTVSQQSFDALSSAGFSLNESVVGIEPSGAMHDVMIGGTPYTLNEEYNAVEVSPGHWQIVDAASGQEHISFEVNPDGTLPPQAIELLEGNGVKVEEIVNTSRVVATEELTGLDANELIWYNHEQTDHVRRVLWYGNDTPGNYDLNELRTHAGGVGGDWFDEQGNVVIDISRMSPDGSFQGGQEANPFELVGENRLTAAISVSKDTQDLTFNFDFTTTPEGRTIATIPPGHPAYQLFQSGNEYNGHGAFNGRYIEIMEHTGQVNAEQAEEVRILGTYVGESNTAGSLTTTAEHITEASQTSYTMNVAPTQETFQSLIFNSTIEQGQLAGVEPFIPIPVYSRRGLESPNSQLRRGYEHGMYGIEDEETIQELERTTLPELLRDPGARVSMGDATRWYRDVLSRERGEDYVREVEGIVESSPVLTEIDSTTKAIVAIPVAGTKEGSRIFQALSLYGQQPPEAQAATKILLHVNWSENNMRTPEDRAALDLTLTEIARAQTAFPGLRIAVMQTQWGADETPNGVIGHAVRKLFDAAILASKRASDDGRIGEDHEIALIRNDSDQYGMSPDYLNRMTEATVRDGVDAVSGKIRWGIEQVRDMPGLSMVTQFMEGLGGSAERAKAKGIRASVDTVGINTGVRISTLAAVGSIGFGSWTGAASDDLAVGRRIRAVRDRTSYFNESRSYDRRGWRNRLRLRRGASYGGSTEGNPPYDGIIKASGTSIDSDVSRLERAYREERPITTSWDDWSATDRATGLTASRRGEKGEAIGTIAGRVELHVNSIINSWGTDPAHAEMEFHRLFPPARDWEGDEYKGPVYTFSVDADGKKEFKFTESGKKLLEKRISRNNRGKYDSLGSRRIRVNYGKIPARGKIKPPATPRLVGALT